MRASVILIVLIGIVFLLRLRAKLALLAEQIRRLRANALEPVSYRPAPPGAIGGDLAALTADADALGFTMLGDHLEDSSLDQLRAAGGVAARACEAGPCEHSGRAMRWFVDPAGTTFGWFAPFDAGGLRHVVVVLMSHELAAQTITSRQPPASLLSSPPFVDMQTVPMSASLADTLARHRKRAQLDDPERAFIPVRTFEQLTAELDRMRGKAIAWRKAQPVDELLDADLRSLLGAQYDKLSGPIRRRLVARAGAAGPRSGAEGGA